MTRFPNFRGAGRLARYASTVLTVSLLVTLKVEAPCSLQPPLALSYRLSKYAGFIKTKIKTASPATAISAFAAVRE